MGSKVQWTFVGDHHIQHCFCGGKNASQGSKRSDLQMILSTAAVLLVDDFKDCQYCQLCHKITEEREWTPRAPSLAHTLKY